MHRVLVIANETLRAERLHEHLQRSSGAEHVLRIIVPLRLPIAADLGGGLIAAVPLEGLDLLAIAADAEERLAAAVAELRGRGIDASGEVISADPLTAIDQAIAKGPVDEILISTKPRVVSRWLGMDLPRRVSRRYPTIKVTVIENTPRPAMANGA